ncbi:LLM class flavin-dependent oxidoreductase [Kineococcus aurantiacus]|uniref:Alkanesulfonate monooxygenase SsuD/methylene tetrahydromethanopterin reductase-like flavin-dependent oxidoreductase (Luciferase family) n=1 Tax=Kineococcus aurantiacus TaxID=37633 RepID=A0A7Y9AVR8_9ACTN|nr:alkanesulfonate monooxygenase SsuD/methylene tetrahydromethanopterin reductase-like flavin-dependent oxidoreductase (luciferase family) [Kineococcus aurantiacus]
MKFLAMTLITHTPDPVTGVWPTQHERFTEVVENATLAEQWGFDAYGVGERHERPFLSSSPTVVLSNIAARTSRIKLFTTVTTLSLLDPVRAYEDYATLDHLADGRLELIVGKGNGAAQANLFHVTTDDQWDRNAEGYELFRRLWREEQVTWQGRFRPSLDRAETWPAPYQRDLRIWHGSATSEESVEVAAAAGDPLFSANVTYPIDTYARLVEHYRERWAAHGHDPADALVGAGSAGSFVARTSQEARRVWRPHFEARQKAFAGSGVPAVWEDFEDFLARSSALVGSPEEVVDKVGRYHARFGHEVTALHFDRSGFSEAQHRENWDLFTTDVAPVLRRQFPSRPLVPAPAQAQGRAPLVPAAS